MRNTLAVFRYGVLAFLICGRLQITYAQESKAKDSVEGYLIEARDGKLFNLTQYLKRARQDASGLRSHGVWQHPDRWRHLRDNEPSSSSSLEPCDDGTRNLAAARPSFYSPPFYPLLNKTQDSSSDLNQTEIRQLLLAMYIAKQRKDGDANMDTSSLKHVVDSTEPVARARNVDDVVFKTSAASESADSQEPGSFSTRLPFFTLIAPADIARKLEKNSELYFFIPREDNSKLEFSNQGISQLRYDEVIGTPFFKSHNHPSRFDTASIGDNSTSKSFDQKQSVDLSYDQLVKLLAMKSEKQGKSVDQKDAKSMDVVLPKDVEHELENIEKALYLVREAKKLSKDFRFSSFLLYDLLDGSVFCSNCSESKDGNHSSKISAPRSLKLDSHSNSLEIIEKIESLLHNSSEYTPASEEESVNTLLTSFYLNEASTSLKAANNLQNFLEVFQIIVSDGRSSALGPLSDAFGAAAENITSANGVEGALYSLLDIYEFLERIIRHWKLSPEDIDEVNRLRYVAQYLLVRLNKIRSLDSRDQDLLKFQPYLYMFHNAFSNLNVTVSPNLQAELFQGFPSSIENKSYHLYHPNAKHLTYEPAQNQRPIQAETFELSSRSSLRKLYRSSSTPEEFFKAFRDTMFNGLSSVFKKIDSRLKNSRDNLQNIMRTGILHHRVQSHLEALINRHLSPSIEISRNRSRDLKSLFDRISERMDPVKNRLSHFISRPLQHLKHLHDDIRRSHENSALRRVLHQGLEILNRTHQHCVGSCSKSDSSSSSLESYRSLHTNSRQSGSSSSSIFRELKQISKQLNQSLEHYNSVLTNLKKNCRDLSVRSQNLEEGIARISDVVNCINQQDVIKKTSNIAIQLQKLLDLNLQLFSETKPEEISSLVKLAQGILSATC